MVSSVVGSTPWAMTTLPCGAAAAGPATSERAIARVNSLRQSIQTSLEIGLLLKLASTPKGALLYEAVPRSVKRAAPCPADGGDRLFPRADPPDRLRLPQFSEESTDLGPGPNPSYRHDLVAVEERGRDGRRHRLLPSLHQRADHRASRAGPDG